MQHPQHRVADTKGQAGQDGTHGTQSTTACAAESHPSRHTVAEAAQPADWDAVRLAFAHNWAERDAHLYVLKLRLEHRAALVRARSGLTLGELQLSLFPKVQQ
jgi:hypothetical protein